jgi:dipeptidyl-peptidase-4
MNTKLRSSFICCLVIISAIPSICQSHLRLSLDKIYREYLFYPNTIDGIRTMADGAYYTVLESDRMIVRIDYKTGQNKTVLFNISRLPGDGITSIHDYAFSTDEKKILLSTNISRIYRHSFEARYWVYDVITGAATPLADTGKQQLATFSPDGHKVAFVRNNNLYYKDLLDNSIIQVTRDGEMNHIINGAPDWVYEEEFGFSQAYCWSPDSRSLAFYRFDESQVKQYDMTVYNALYPSVSRFKYPKAGEANSVVSILVFNPGSGKTIKMDVGAEEDQYIPRIKWTEQQGKLCIIRLNRLQNKVDVLLAEAASGETKVLYSEENERYLSRIYDD